LTRTSTLAELLTKPLLQQPHAKAAKRVATMCYSGVGCSVDKSKAHRFYDIAANTGDAEALNALGMTFLPIGRILRRSLTLCGNWHRDRRTHVRRRRWMRLEFPESRRVLSSRCRPKQPPRALQLGLFAVKWQRRQAQHRCRPGSFSEGTPT
jgi:TPR repeat protein